VPAFDWSQVDVVVPRPAARCGVPMAGFRLRVAAPVDIAMVAHPSVTLLVDLSGGAYEVRGPGGRTYRGSVVAGLVPGDVRVVGAAPGDCLQVRLPPPVAAALFGPVSELTGAVVPLDAFWGRATDRLVAATTWDERFARTADLLRRRAVGSPVDPEVAHAWRRTVAGRGQARVGELAGEVGWSRQRLWSRFRHQLGLGPKEAARLVRFDHAAHLLAAGRPAADVAGTTGYTDQSHLHRDVRDFTGLTPVAVAAAPWLAVDDVAWPDRGTRPVPVTRA
jgi:AraC-like DNA-binding protein